jgi:hypothetical protein
MHKYVTILVGYMFMEIVTESKTYHIYKSILLTIKVAVHNVSGARRHESKNLSTQKQSTSQYSETGCMVVTP